MASVPPPGMVSLRSIVDATRVGRRTVGRVDDASLIFRFVEHPSGSFGVEPASERATTLAGSPAGARLERALTRFAAQAETGQGMSDLESVTLVPDVDAMAGFSLLSAVEGSPEFVPAAEVPRLRAELARMARAIREDVQAGAHGAVNDGGRVFVMPEHSHALLASVGAYAVAPGELDRRSPKEWRAFMSGLLRHEVEHSITPGSGDPESWEEGIAQVLSGARPARQAARHDLPVPPAGWGVQDPGSPSVTEDWKPATPAPSDARDQWNSAYDLRERTLARLLTMAGIERDTPAGYADARKLLQGVAVEDVPQLVAARLIERHRADPRILPALSIRIEDLDSPRMIQEVAAMLAASHPELA